MKKKIWVEGVRYLCVHVVDLCVWESVKNIPQLEGSQYCYKKFKLKINEKWKLKKQGRGDFDSRLFPD